MQYENDQMTDERENKNNGNGHLGLPNDAFNTVAKNLKENASGKSEGIAAVTKNAGENAKAASVAASGAAASAGNAATAGTAATGVGLPVAAVMQILQKAKEAKQRVDNTAENITHKGTAEDDYGTTSSIFWLSTVIIIMILFIYFIMGTMIHLIIPGSVESYRESQFNTEGRMYDKFTKDGFETVQQIIADYKGLEEYDGTAPNEDAAEVYRKIIDASITEIFSEFCKDTLKKYDLNFIEKISSIENLLLDESKTQEEFLSCPYPYSTRKSDGSIYTISDFLNGKIPEDELNNDINYAEVVAVLSMNPDFNINSDSCTIEKFAQFLSSDKAKKYMYEIKMTPKIQYNDIGIPVSYYYEFDLKPYGLRELFLIAEVSEMDPDKSFPNQTNIDMLERREYYFRTYARTYEPNLGPSYNEERSNRSLIFGQGANKTKTGRSSEYYIKNADNLDDILEIPIWDMPEKPPVTPTYDFVEGTKIINMPDYINQGTCSAAGMRRGSSSTTVKSSGCCDCSYIMIAEYYTGKNITVESIAGDSSMYNGSSLNTPLFLEKFGMTQNGNIPFDINTIRFYIDKGMPLIFHIRGKWIYNGTVYHKTDNGHFLTIIGYDEKGLYVYDPGSNANTKNGPIPYEAFPHVNDKYIRAPHIIGFPGAS